MSHSFTVHEKVHCRCSPILTPTETPTDKTNYFVALLQKHSAASEKTYCTFGEAVDGLRSR